MKDMHQMETRKFEIAIKKPTIKFTTGHRQDRPLLTLHKDISFILDVVVFVCVVCEKSGPLL